jgi:hypothetical protein
VNEPQRETTFLRKIIVLSDDSDRRSRLESQIVQALRDERCVHRAVMVMVLFVSLSGAGLGYSAIALNNFPFGENGVGFKLLCEAALASVISLAGFTAVWIFYRWKLRGLREDCRQLVARFLESSRCP